MLVCMGPVQIFKNLEKVVDAPFCQHVNPKHPRVERRTADLSARQQRKRDKEQRRMKLAA
jgi:hypothetical protein